MKNQRLDLIRQFDGQFRIQEVEGKGTKFLKSGGTPQ